MKFAPRRTILVVLLLGIAAGTIPAFAQFPDKPIRLVVPFPPGGPTDIVARPLAQLLGESLKQNVIVENRGGAGGSIGADLVAKSPPDGYTLLMGTVGTSAINAALYRKLPHDPVREMRSRDKVPLALVFNSVNPILAQGAALGDITMLAGFDEDVTAAVAHGAEVEVDPVAKTLRVL